MSHAIIWPAAIGLERGLSRALTSVGVTPSPYAEPVIRYLEEAVILLGGAEHAADAFNTRIREIEAAQGIPPGRSRASVHPATVRAWLRGSQPRYAIVIRAVCDVTRRRPDELGWARSSVEDVDRREFLTGAAVVLGGAILPLLGDLGAPPNPDPDEFARQAAELWATYSTTKPLTLVYRAADHAEHGRSLLARSRGSDHHQISDAIGLTVLLAGRSAYFDLGRAGSAQELWSVADRYLADSHDHALQACLHGHQAFVPGWAGRWDEAEGELRIAAGYARRGGGPALRSWLHAVAAECLSRSGRPREALAQVERARETLVAGGASCDPWWLDFFDAQRLDGFDAAVALAAGREVLVSEISTQRTTRHALDRVERALRYLHTSTELPAEYTPQDCVTVLDRAIAYALIHDDDQALGLAEAACQALAQRPYVAAQSRLGTLYDTLPASRVGQLHEIERSYLAA